MNLIEFVNKIKLSKNLLEHLKHTEGELLHFIEELYNFNDVAIEIFLFDAMIKENISSSELERGLYSPSVVNICQDKLKENRSIINKEMICDINKCILIDNGCEGYANFGEYRNVLAWVGTKNGKPGIENARYVAPGPEHIENLMNQFYNYINTIDNQNIIIKTAILHILFIKIHPFSDGNGRTARIIHHHNLTQLINLKYGTSFQWPIINLSKGLDLTRGNYYTCENDIIFDIETDNFESWNRWFDYILNKIDDNIYYYRESLRNEKERLGQIENNKVLRK